MPGITLAIAQDNLSAALAALQDARTQQSYQIQSTSGGRSVVRGSLEAIQKDVDYWDQKVKALSRGGAIRTFFAVCP